jgi:hypothetical protein
MVIAAQAMAVDPFMAGRRAKAPDVQAGIPLPSADELVERAFRDYISCVRKTSCDYYGRLLSTQAANGRIILTPSQISLLLNRLTGSFDLSGDDGNLFPAYLNIIVQFSYNAGHNDFSLDTISSSVAYFGAVLHGKRDKPLTLRIQGDVGFRCAEYAEYIHLSIAGNVGFGFAHESENSVYYVEGDMEMIADTVKNCTFKTHNPRTYSWLADLSNWEIPGTSRCNTIMLLDENDNTLEQKVMPQ